MRLPCGLCALSVIQSWSNTSRPVILFVLFCTTTILHCFAVHEPDCMSKWSTFLISMSLQLKHLYFVLSLYGWITSLSILSVTSMDFCAFMNNRGNPVSPSHWSFPSLVIVSTQNSPFVFCSFVHLFVG